MNTKLLPLLFLALFGGMCLPSAQAQWTTFPNVDMILHCIGPNATIWGTSRSYNQLAFYKDGQQTLRPLPSSVGPNTYIYEVLWQNDTLWVGTTKGLVRISNKDTLVYNLANSAIKDTVKALYRFDNVLYALGPSTIYRYEGSTWRSFLQTNGIYYNDFVMSRDSIYLTSNKGLWKMGLDRVPRKSVYYGNFYDQYDHIAFDAKGKIWLNSWWELFRYENGSFYYFGQTTLPNFAAAGFENFAFDEQGNVWMAYGKEGAGFLQLPGTFSKYTTANSNIASDNAHSVLVVDGKVYVGGFYGLSVMSSSFVTSIDESSTPSKHYYFSIYDALGKELYPSLSEQEYSETMAELSGLYMVRIQQEGKWVGTKKVLR